jgi:hypothetical protein
MTPPPALKGRLSPRLGRSREDGRCPGGNVEYVPDEMIRNGAQAIQLATGFVVGYLPCPHLGRRRDASHPGEVPARAPGPRLPPHFRSPRSTPNPSVRGSWPRPHSPRPESSRGSLLRVEPEPVVAGHLAERLGAAVRTALVLTAHSRAVGQPCASRGPGGAGGVVHFQHTMTLDRPPGAAILSTFVKQAFNTSCSRRRKATAFPAPTTVRRR